MWHARETTALTQYHSFPQDGDSSALADGAEESTPEKEEDVEQAVARRPSLVAGLLKTAAPPKATWGTMTEGDMPRSLAVYEADDVELEGDDGGGGAVQRRSAWGGTRMSTRGGQGVKGRRGVAGLALDALTLGGTLGGNDDDDDDGAPLGAFMRARFNLRAFLLGSFPGHLVILAGLAIVQCLITTCLW